MKTKPLETCVCLSRMSLNEEMSAFVSESVWAILLGFVVPVVRMLGLFVPWCWRRGCAERLFCLGRRYLAYLLSGGFCLRLRWLVHRFGMTTGRLQLRGNATWRQLHSRPYSYTSHLAMHVTIGEGDLCSLEWIRLVIAMVRSDKLSVPSVLVSGAAILSRIHAVGSMSWWVDGSIGQ